MSGEHKQEQGDGWHVHAVAAHLDLLCDAEGLPGEVIDPPLLDAQDGGVHREHRQTLNSPSLFRHERAVFSPRKECRTICRQRWKRSVRPRAPSAAAGIAGSILRCWVLAQVPHLFLRVLRVRLVGAKVLLLAGAQVDARAILVVPVVQALDLLGQQSTLKTCSCDRPPFAWVFWVLWSNCCFGCPRLS